MKRFIPLLILSILTVVGTVTSFGQAGIFTGTIGISANGGGLAWYSLVSQTNNGAGLFGEAFLGTFNITNLETSINGFNGTLTASDNFCTSGMTGRFGGLKDTLPK